jgi:uncharacterized protein YndB with AHSA1/START domain
MATKTFIAEPGKQEMVMTRVFDAPRELVFDAYADPDRIPLWWGPTTLTTIVDQMDVRPGGTWRFIQHDPDGNEYGFHGVYHAVERPERVVYTFEFEGMPGHVVLETVTFEEQDGRTKMTVQSVFQAVEDRDGMLASMLEDGADDIWDRLAELLQAIDAA